MVWSLHKIDLVAVAAVRTAVRTKRLQTVESGRE